MKLFPVAAAALVLLAQQPLPESGGGIVIRSTTALVEVRVVAEDAGGRKVTDLRREDFRIADDGKPQPITMFTAARAAAAARAASVPESGKPQQDSAAGYSYIVLDWLNTSYVNQVGAQDAAVKLLSNFPPGQKVAVYVLSHEPFLLTDFTGDTDILSQLVKNLPLDTTDMTQPHPAMRIDPRHTDPPAGTDFELLQFHRRILDTTQALTRIADRLSRMPGRKSLIWVTEGFPVQLGPRGLVVSYRQDMEKLIARLNRGDIGVYTIDARGLPVSATNGFGFGDILLETAERTGGTAFYNRNDLDQGIRDALEDRRIGYSLAYRLPDRHEEGPHEIHVQVKRKGVTLRYRESYDLVVR